MTTSAGALAPRLPVIAAPMFLVSGIDYVVAACCAGVHGSFPTANCRTPDELDEWLHVMRTRIDNAPNEEVTERGAIWPNLIVHHSNTRRDTDLAIVIEHGVQHVITSVGSPQAVIKPLHDAGCEVFADVASLRHAQRAVQAGADGLILLSAGAGGQTGWANPFAFARAVRQFWSGPMVLAGGISDGQALFAARALGFDMAYMGTGLIATDESMAKPAYKQMLVETTLDDIVLTTAFTGLETNMLRPSIEAAGLDPDNLPKHGGLDASRDLDAQAREASDQPKRWRDVWSAGHSVSGTVQVSSLANRIACVRRQYKAAAEHAHTLAEHALKL